MSVITGPWEVLSAERLELGEGARFIDGRVHYVDLLAGRLFVSEPRAGSTQEKLLNLGVPLGAVAPTAGGGLVGAVDRGAARLTRDGIGAWLGRPAAHSSVPLRINDAAVDPGGRLWVGSTAWDNTVDAGALYQFDMDGKVSVAVQDLTIPNGPAFAADGRTMYLADTAKSVICAFALDPKSGILSDRHVFAEVDGSPDGMTVDHEGFLWVAIWGSSCLHRYSPDGSVEEVIAVPACQPTSVALSPEPPYVIVVTSATYGLDPTDDDGHTLIAPAAVGAPQAPTYQGSLPRPGSSR